MEKTTNFVITNQLGVHFTHNDSDGLGCALVTEYIGIVRELLEGDVLPIIEWSSDTIAFGTIHANMNSIGKSSQMIDQYISTALSIIRGSEYLPEDIKTFNELNNVVKDSSIIYIPKFLYISDLPLNEDVAEMIDSLRKFGGIVPLYIDHHQSMINQEWIKKYDWMHVSTVDENGTPISAAKLMETYFLSKIKNLSEESKTVWKFFHNVINDISRYDTWEWRNNPIENGNEFLATAIINYYGSCKKAYDKINDEWFSSVILNNNEKQLTKLSDLSDDFKFIEKNYLMMMEKSAYIAKRVRFYRGSEFGWNDKESSYIVGLFITPDDCPSISFESIYNNYDVDVVIGINTTTHGIGFRCSADKDIDLSYIANRYYGGGGHPKASGALLGIDDFLNIMRMYYIASDQFASAEKSMGILMEMDK